MTIPPPLSPDEPLRLTTLRRLRMLDTPIEARFERLTRLAQRSFGVKICAVSLVDAGRQWFKSVQGTSTCETSREVSFCGHAILEPDVFVVEDARLDERFKDNPMVTGEPHVRFYAGAQIRMGDGTVAGMLCLKHDDPRTLDPDEADMLRDMAATAAQYLETQRVSRAEASLINDTSTAERRAMIDTETRVWNGDGFGLVARQMTSDHSGGNAPPSTCGCALMVLRIEHGKERRIMASAARRLLELVRDTDTVGRLDQDTLAVLFAGCVDDETARATCAPVLERMHGRAFRNEQNEPVDAGAVHAVTRTIHPGARGGYDDALEGALAEIGQRRAA